MDTLTLTGVASTPAHILTASTRISLLGTSNDLLFIMKCDMYFPHDREMKIRHFFERSMPQVPLSPPGLLERPADPRYSLSSEVISMNHHPVHQNLPFRAHQSHSSDPQSPSVYQEETSNPIASHGPGYVTKRMQSFDLESQ